MYECVRVFECVIVRLCANVYCLLDAVTKTEKMLIAQAVSTLLLEAPNNTVSVSDIAQHLRERKFQFKKPKKLLRSLPDVCAQQIFSFYFSISHYYSNYYSNYHYTYYNYYS